MSDLSVILYALGYAGYTLFFMVKSVRFYIVCSGIRFMLLTSKNAQWNSEYLVYEVWKDNLAFFLGIRLLREQNQEKKSTV